MGLFSKIGKSLKKLVTNPKKWGRSLIHDPGAMAAIGAAAGFATGGFGFLPAALSSSATTGVAAGAASSAVGATAGTAAKAVTDRADPKGTAAFKATEKAKKVAEANKRRALLAAQAPLAADAARRRRGLAGRSMLRSSFLGRSGAGATTRLGV